MGRAGPGHCALGRPAEGPGLAGGREDPRAPWWQPQRGRSSFLCVSSLCERASRPEALGRAAGQRVCQPRSHGVGRGGAGGSGVRAGAGRAGRGGLSHRGVVFFESAITWYFEDPARGQDPLRRVGSQGAAACGVGGVSVFLPATSVTPIQVHFPPEQRRCRHGGAAVSEGPRGPHPPSLRGDSFPLFLLLGFPTGTRPTRHPLPQEPHSSSSRTGLGAALQLCAGPRGSSDHRGLRGAPDASRDPQLGARPSRGHACFPRPLCPLFCLAFFLPILSPPSPRVDFLCINNSPVRKQYHFRSEDERDINLVEGKFSFTV